jgi:2-haloacid dehalogenase
VWPLKGTPLDRRSFVTLGSVSLTSPVVEAAFAPTGSARSIASVTGSIEAVACDAFAIFDPRPIFAACELAVPGRGTELANAWRVRQFEYQWLRALTGMYANFWDVTASALEFAAHSMNLDLSPRQRADLMNGYLALRAWPDVKDALSTLQRAGIQVALLSNATEQILAAGIHNSDLSGAFQHVISTDCIKTFKPDPRAYRLGTQIMRLHEKQILFVAFAGWDVAGAAWFGYPTFWNNRQNATAEELNVRADGTGATLTDLVRFLQTR